MILLPVLVIGVLELTLHLIKYGDDLSIFVPFEKGSEYLKINEHFGQRYFFYYYGDEFNAPVVPVKTVFECVSPNGLIGGDIMLEHVHSNVKGYFLMADAFYRIMQNNHLFPDVWTARSIPPGTRLSEPMGNDAARQHLYRTRDHEPEKRLAVYDGIIFDARRREHHRFI
jgi:hypothetical protein